MRKLSPLKIIAIAIVLLGLFPVGIYVYHQIQFSREIRKITADQAWILYHVDHKVLAREARSFAKDLRAHGISFGEVRGDDPAVPAGLAVLKPRSIQIIDGYVRVEFGGMLWHYGIVVYDEGLEGPGTKRLGEGVWFYSENGRYPGFFGEKKKGPPCSG